MLTIYAHRGMWFPQYPENSLEAFREAELQGFPSECDVWLSRDGEPVVIHDETLDRTTDVQGKIADFSAAQLGQIRTRIPSSKQFFSPVPLLKDVGDLVHAVEIKPAKSRALVSSVLSIMTSKRWFLQSFDPANLQIALEIDSQLPVALLVENEAGIDCAIDHHWAVHMDHRLLDDRIAGRLRDAGLKFGVWTVNFEESIHRVLQWNPDVVISDVPLLVRRIVQRAGISSN